MSVRLDVSGDWVLQSRYGQAILRISAWTIPGPRRPDNEHQRVISAGPADVVQWDATDEDKR